MKNIAEKLLTNAPPIILLILVSILVLPAFIMATGPKPSNVGLPQKIQDPEKLQRALYALVRKADAQSKIINNWYRKARLKTTRMQAKKTKQDTKAIAAAASRRAFDSLTAMVGPDHMYTRPVQNLFRDRERTKAFLSAVGGAPGVGRDQIRRNRPKQLRAGENFMPAKAL
jgi:hypothetical protein